MTKKDDTNQSYMLVHKVASIFSGSTSIFLNYIILSISVYLLLFIPMSYQTPEGAYNTWWTVCWILLLIALLSGIFHITYQFIYDREVTWLAWVALISNWLILGILLVLNVLGLYPASAFLKPFLIAIPIGYFLLVQIYFFSLRYKEYLARSVAFVEQASNMLTTICTVNFLLVFGFTLRDVLARAPGPDFVLKVFDLVGSAALIYFSITVSINDPRGSRIKTIISTVLCVALAAVHYIDQGFLSFWWLGMAGLSSSIFYSAHSPSRLKSGPIAIALFCTMYIALFLDNVTFTPTVDTVWNVIVKQVLPIVGGIGAILAIFGFTLKTLVEKWRSQTILPKDVTDASREIISTHGYSVFSCDQILKIAFMSRDFSFCDDLLKDPRSFPPGELRDYFETSLLCAKYKDQGRVNVIKMDAEHNPMHVTLEKADDLSAYLVTQFPAFIHDGEVWSAYASKNYITAYVDKKRLDEMRPNTFSARFSRFMRTAITILFILILFSSTIMPLLGDLPDAVAGIANWNHVRSNEAKLVLTLALKPYELEDADIKAYYASAMWDWIGKRRQYISDSYHDGTYFMSPEKMESQIAYLEVILSFYDVQDDLYFILNNEIGGLHAGLGACDRAFDYFARVLDGTYVVEHRDFALAMGAGCYQSEDLPKALELLEEAHDSPDYLLSRARPAEILYSQMEYGEVIDLLLPISETVNINTRMLLGESYYLDGWLDESITVLEDILLDEAPESPGRVNHAFMILGSAYYDLDDPFNAAEYYFQGFSGQLCPYYLVISDEELAIHIPRFKDAIDRVSSENLYDTRINLWNFLYFHYMGDTEQATDFLNAHIGSEASYEREFIECIYGE